MEGVGYTGVTNEMKGVNVQKSVYTLDMKATLTVPHIENKKP